MHLTPNYQSIHIQHQIDLVKDVIDSQEKKMTLYNAKIRVSIDYRLTNVHMCLQ